MKEEDAESLKRFASFEKMGEKLTASLASPGQEEAQAEPIRQVINDLKWVKDSISVIMFNTEEELGNAMDEEDRDFAKTDRLEKERDRMEYAIQYVADAINVLEKILGKE
jgi:hypothetical protein